MHSDDGYGGISQKASMKVRVRFFKPLELSDVIDDIADLLHQKTLHEPDFDIHQIHIEKGPLRASPAAVETNHPFVQLIENCIQEETGIAKFIHQYHGGSDIRLPILYGNCKCVGIGPSCDLPAASSNQKEWISIDDYITGIKILARILIEYIHYC